MRVLLAGHNERGIEALHGLWACAEHELVGVISVPEKQSEAGYFRSVASVAREYGLTVYEPEYVNDPTFVAELERLQPDVLVMVGYPKLVGQRLRSLPSYGALNVHASPLPRYRGAAPLNWMLIHGEPQGAISVLEPDSGIDTGPILYQEFFAISEDSSIQDLAAYVNHRTPQILQKVLGYLEWYQQRKVVQDPAEGFFMTKRYPVDGHIDFRSMTVRSIYNLVRALKSPYPGAFFIYDGAFYVVEQCRRPSRCYYGIPGRVAARGGEGVVVVAADGGVVLEQIRLSDGTFAQPSELGIPVGADLV